MKKRNNYVQLKSSLLIIGFFSSMLIIGCSEDNDSPSPVELTQQELVIDALDGVWDVDLESSTIPNKTSLGLTSGSANINIDTGGNGAIVMAGDLANYVSGGAFVVDATGSITNPSVEVNSNSGLVADNVVYELAQDQSTLSVSFGISSAARVAGLGTWTLIIDLN